MKIVYYTPGTTGSGRLVLGLAIATALRRRQANAEFLLLTSSPFANLAEALEIPCRIVEPDSGAVLTGAHPEQSEVLAATEELAPDWLVIDFGWHRIQPLLPWLSCKVAALMWQTAAERFALPLESGELRFDPSLYEHVYTIEPWHPPFEAEQLNPLLLRNPGELLSREEAAAALGLDAQAPTAFVALNGRPGEFEELKSRYSYLEDAGYQVLYSSNYSGGLFPALDYYNAFDLVVCGAGYSQFWEAVCFDKEAVFVAQERHFESQAWRVEACQSYTFTENGADQLVPVLLEG